MRVRVLFFGMLKEVTGHAAEDAGFPEGADLRVVFNCYAERFPRLREMARSIVVARNQEFADLSTMVSEGDEIAFLPPVSGGAFPKREGAAQPDGEMPRPDGPMAQPPHAEPAISAHGQYFALTRHSIDIRSIVARLQTGAEGAVVTFEGTVRNNTKGRRTLYLDYDCYEPMALKTMAAIGQDLARSHEVTGVAMVHRLGRMLVGETSVAVIVAAPHRRPAFEAALEGINRLKQTVPIWKKEHFVDGEVWVEGEWDRDVPVAG